MTISGDESRPLYATGTDTDDGDYTTALVAAVSGKKIRVVALSATVLTTAGVFSLKSGSTVVFRAHLALGMPLVMVAPDIGICETASGEALVPNNAAGVDSFVNITYVTVEP